MERYRMVGWAIPSLHLTSHHPLPSLPVPLPISLLERGSVFALVGLAVSVSIVVVVIAFTIALGAHRIESLAIARVVAPRIETVAIAVLRRDVPVGAVATPRHDDARILIHRCAIHATGSVSAG